MPQTLTAYCDGGCRGNPGPSSCAFAVYMGSEEVHRGGKFLGTKTNNEAEYEGLIALLEYLHGHFQRVLIFSDSALVVNQVNGAWKINDEKLRPLVARAYALLVRGRHTLQLIKGHSGILGNETVDQICNEVLDTNEKAK
jgi:ribonuclease HI